MSTWTLLTIIGWVALITSWVLPRFIKDKTDKSFWGASFSAFALGIFVGALITSMG